MQKVYLLNVTLTVLILTLSFFTGSLLAQTTSSVFHQAQDIKSGTFGSNVGGGNYFFPANLEASNQITAGTMFKTGGTEFTSSYGKIGGDLTVTGNVGIGTTTPGEKLEVNGNIKLSGSTPTYKITNLALPTEASDAATKGYVDAQISSTWGCGDDITFTYNGISVTYGTVLGANNKCWLDRNLGAQRVATAYNDIHAYGDLFQWGRCADGHQLRTSSTYAGPVSSATCNGTGQDWNGKFVTDSNVSPYDWINPQDNTLWQGVNGTNNPCPSGWRIPTEAEWNTERLSWSSNDAAGAFASPLKLTVGGYRHRSSGSLDGVGSSGYYWSSTVSGTDARYLSFFSTGAYMGSNYRAYGFSVRCVKD